MRVARLDARRSTRARALPISRRVESRGDPRIIGRGREKFIVQYRRFAAKGSPLPRVRERFAP